MSGAAAARDECEHRLAQGLRTTDAGIALDLVEGLGDQLDGGLRIDGPVRDEKRAGEA